MVDITNLGILENNIYNTNISMQNMQKIHNKNSSGKEFGSFEEMAKKNNLDVISLLKDRVAISKSFISTNKNTIEELKFTSNKIGESIEIATDFQRLLTERRSSSGEFINFEERTLNLLQNLQFILNSKFANNYPFSGDDSTKEPVRDIVNKSNIIDGEYSTNYYNGSSRKMKLLIGVKTSSEIGALASDDGFKYSIGAMHKGIEASKENDLSKIGQVIDDINLAVEKLANLRLKVDSDIQKIDNINNSIEVNYNDNFNLLSSLVDANIPLNAIELNSQMLILQASFTSIAKISKLNLVDFL